MTQVEGDLPPPMRWEDQPPLDLDAFRLTASADFPLARRVLAALGRSDAIEAIERRADLVRQRLRNGVFRY